ncbi:DUF262 domain-containing protein [Hyunsoonleella sp. 2307UL5-6]|uniref:DUF262 domain-containing protein n=1 Tax=Hyunsoonleella sp. 2307UL5-6 TaxID=3384768 RepID=UPI0039BC5AF4
MEQPFKPLSLSIKELFTNADSKYKIPQYQRPYKWEGDQVFQLWDDIYEAYENKEKNYFLGSIITAKPRDNENSSYVDVVDGQQRLTTLTIMLCVVRDLFPNLNANNEKDNAVKPMMIQHSISEFGQNERLKLNTHAQHQSDFEKLILKGDTKELTKPYKYQIRTDEEPKFKFVNTASIFKEKLQEIGEEEAGEFINFLFNQVQIIRIDCTDRQFAIKLFQVLNDRGMDLSAADLIKSFLLEKLYKKYKEDPDNSKLKEERFIADWREMEQTVKKCDINMNDLFIIYEYYLLAANPKKSLYDELQDIFEDKDPNEVIEDIKAFVNTYLSEILEQEDKILYSFRYIRWSMYWKCIAMTAIHSNYSHKIEVMSQLRRFYYLYWIGGKTLSQIKQTSFNIIKWIKEKKSITFIKEELDKKLDTDKILDLVVRNLTSERIATEPWIKPLLLMMEYNVTDDSKLSFIPLSKDVHLEHILPVKFEKFEEWNHFTTEDAYQWLNSAGNLTLLGGSKNIEASNNPFNIKMGVYKGKGKYESKNDKITAFLITQSIVQDYEKETYNKKWNIDAIHNRWKWFFTETEELLDIDLSNEKEALKPKLV